MPVTVHFATNRVLDGPAEDLGSYSESVVAPSKPEEVTYGTAFVDDANLDADTIGAITRIQNTGKGAFSRNAFDDLSDPGRNLLVFIHGFDNSFENAITRAAFNQQWFMKSGLKQAETSVVAFSWPSAGKLISLPFPSAAYRRDQTKAGQSGLHIMTFFANLEQIIINARAKGKRVILLAHSMGNWALQSAVESWFAHGNGDAFLFDEAILAAADEIHSSFDFQPAGRLSALDRLARRVSVYASDQDVVLDISMKLNFAKRLGQDGAHDRSNAERFPTDKYRTVMCGGFTDYKINLGSSHQYYRRSPGVRMDIANTMAGNV